jgi:hypothetical protein
LTKIFDSDGAGQFHPCIEKDHTKVDHAVNESGFNLNFEGGTSIKDMAEAEQVMKRTVGDAEIWGMLKINTNVIKAIFGDEGIQVRDILDVLVRHEKVAHIAIDVGVVRFPRAEDPFFKLYRFRVIVFRSATSIGPFDKKTSGIWTEFRSRVYNMDKKFTAQFDKKHTALVTEKLKSAMALLDD